MSAAQAGDHSKGRRLPAAGGSKQTEELATLDGEAGTLDSDKIAEGLVQFVDLDLRHGVAPQSGNLVTTTNITVPAKIVTNE